MRLAILICAFLLFGGPAAAQDPLRVTFVNPGKTDEVFWKMVADSMAAAARDLDISLEVLFAQRNRVRMLELAEEVISRRDRPDYLVLVNEEQSAGPMVRGADRVGVRTVLLLNDFVGEQAVAMGEPRRRFRHWLGSLTPDNENAGRRMARRLIEQATPGADGKIHLLALAGDRRTPASLERNAGLMKALTEHPGVVLDRILFANWNAEEAEDLTRRYLEWAARNRVRPALVWAANDPIAEGAMRALRAAGHEPGKDVLVAGLNWSPFGLESVKRGEMLLTDGGHFLAGAWVMVLLRDHADGNDFAASSGARHRFSMSAIDQNNVDAYLERFSDRDWDKVDFSRFLRPRHAGSEYDFSLSWLLASASGAPAPSSRD